MDVSGIFITHESQIKNHSFFHSILVIGLVAILSFISRFVCFFFGTEGKQIAIAREGVSLWYSSSTKRHSPPTIKFALECKNHLRFRAIFQLDEVESFDLLLISISNKDAFLIAQLYFIVRRTRSSHGRPLSIKSRPVSFNAIISFHCQCEECCFQIYHRLK